MTPRKRVINALKRELPDKVPKEFELSDQINKIFKEKTGKKDTAEYFNLEMRWSRTEYYEPSVDMEILKEKAEKICGEVSRVDAWGLGYHKSKWEEYHFEKRIHPLAGDISIRDIEQYPFPNIKDDLTERLGKIVKENHQRGYAAISHICMTGGNAIQALFNLRGMEDTLSDLMLNLKMVTALLERLLELNLELLEKVVATGVDVVYMGDDYSMQTGMLFPKKLFVDIFKPHIRKIITKCKKINPNVIVAHHCDGNCTEIIPDFIEAGIDVLNPVQPECMDVFEVKKEYGKNLSFWGTIGTQHLLPLGTPDEIDATVRKTIELVGKGGGLLIAPSHLIEPEVPWENIMAFVNAAEKYGCY